MASQTSDLLREALALHRRGAVAEAAARYSALLRADPHNVDAHYYLGLIACQQGRFAEGGDRARQALSGDPGHAPAHVLLGRAAAALGRPAEALASFDRALELAPDLAQAHGCRADILSELGRFGEAVEAYDRALAAAPDRAEDWFNRATALLAIGRLDDAIASFDRTVALKPDFAPARLLRAKALLDAGRRRDALEAVDAVLALHPQLPQAWVGRANILSELQRYQEAGTACDRALALMPDLAEAWLGRGNIFRNTKQYGGALAAYDRALALTPNLAGAWLGRGNVLIELKRYGDAFAAYDRALQLNPGLKFAAGERLHAKLMVCNWTDIASDFARVLSDIRRGTPSCMPFSLLSVPSSAAEQFACARRCIQDQRSFPPVWRGEVYSHDRIRVAYLSADFGEHPVSRLLVRLLERHDRSRFEVTAISFGSAQNSPLRQRIIDAVDHFIDTGDDSDEEVAALIRRREIDILVDLMGYTSGYRINVLAQRPAPIQINYLGLIGTMGAPFIDYVIADEIALPFDQQPFFSEKIVHLPDCFLPTDDTQEIAPRTPSRGEAGLPPEGFVFCSFNNSYKLNPPIFEAWMRLLRAVPGSVLWLAQSNSEMVGNLAREAERCGADPRRVIFAPRVPHAQHLARQRLAGLFLDTGPYNAGATAAAALWAGLPVVTCLGETFVGRMAASMLYAVGLRELVVNSLPEYEALASKIASDPALCAGLKDKLARNRASQPLFNTASFARNIEQAYATMVNILRQGERPRSFRVQP